MVVQSKQLCVICTLDVSCFNLEFLFISLCLDLLLTQNTTFSLTQNWSLPVFLVNALVICLLSISWYFTCAISYEPAQSLLKKYSVLLDTTSTNAVIFFKLQLGICTSKAMTIPVTMVYVWGGYFFVHCRCCTVMLLCTFPRSWQRSTRCWKRKSWEFELHLKK